MLLSFSGSYSFQSFSHNIGSFNRVDQKLRDLASGHWKGRDISNRVGPRLQKGEMRIPVLQAIVTREISILWQIDTGFYENRPWERQQVVKSK